MVLNKHYTDGIHTWSRKMFYGHERFQTHCKKCYKVFEADTAHEVIQLVDKHEKDKKCPSSPVTVPTPNSMSPLRPSGDGPLMPQ